MKFFATVLLLCSLAICYGFPQGNSVNKNTLESVDGKADGDFQPERVRLARHHRYGGYGGFGGLGGYGGYPGGYGGYGGYPLGGGGGYGGGYSGAQASASSSAYGGGYGGGFGGFGK